MRILVQFIAQAVGVVLLRQRNGTKNLPFKMWLYPLPVIVSIPIWLFIFFSTGIAALFAVILIMIGILVFYITKDWWKKEKTEFNSEPLDE
jgi:amino acid transporter